MDSFLQGVDQDQLMQLLLGGNLNILKCSITAFEFVVTSIANIST